MTIAIGERFPDVTLKTPGPDGPEELRTGAFLAGRRVVLFALPGAFTPGCSNTHMPGFVVNADKLLARGIDAIACLAVNDAFVMGAWQKDQNAQAMTMLADGNAELTHALGMENDRSASGMGLRSKRFAMILDDGVVTWLGIDEQGVDQSSAESVLARL
ncbi:peroxiredoxin [uncultured Halomonas sp.]|uniref:peroxiredoxin n=1 Tax=Halomonas mongoliensis TaxID=321265 RepID=UPI0026088059|nr:peroxiredoxin [uncultured Halomonas sp.]